MPCFIQIMHVFLCFICLFETQNRTQVSETLERVLHDLHQRSSELCSFYHKEQANGLKDFTDLVMGFHKKHADGLKAHNGVSVRWQVGVTVRTTRLHL